MSITFELIRPDDLLNLSIIGQNLRLERTSRRPAALVVENRAQPAYLIVIFPPQAIAETAFFETSPIKPESDRPDPDAAAITEPLPGPGGVKARLAHPSRLVFTVPPGTRIPVTFEGLLDWSKLEPSLAPIAAIPPNPTAAQIAAAPAIARPSPTETALELPYKLIVSPNGAARWQHRHQPFTACGRTELWHTRLQLATADGPLELTSANPAPLRAIWSDDYTPNAPPPMTATDLELGRTAMSPNDRYQIVILTSAFHGYEVDQAMPILFPLVGGLAAEALAEPGASGAVIGDRLLNQRWPRYAVAYVPQPFLADQLILSPLGGWLRSRGRWDPPRRAKRLPPFTFPILDRVLRPGDERFSEAEAPAHLPPEQMLSTAAITDFEQFLSPDLISALFPRPPAEEQLDLSEWVHRASQGRDHYVRIVYEGELWPFRNRAALIKVTERKFKEQNGLVVAYLFQRMFIVVREPERRFPATDRGMPLKRVRLTTLVTPDIADPAVIAGSNRSFWVEIMTNATSRARFKFHAVGTDIAGNEVDFSLPLLFVSISETAASRQVAAETYNASGSADLLNARAAIVPGQKVMLAAVNPAQPNDNTFLVTNALNFVMNKAGTAPTLLKADVKIPQVEELLGTTAPTSIRFYQGYLDQGFDGATGVFAEIIKEDFGQFRPDNPFAGLAAQTLGVTFTSDQAGGFATPNLGISTLSRELGPLAGKVQDALTDSFDPASFFKKGLATLFGTFDLVDLLPIGSLGQNAPKLQTASRPVAGGRVLVATLDWEPEVKNLDLGIAAFEKDYLGNLSRLVIHGRIEKPVTFDSLGAPIAEGATYEFTGILNDFRISVLKAVFINFKSFGFVTRSGQKPDVRVTLDVAKPVEFDGDLKFVEELRKAIPPDLFGDGPSLDIAPTGIRAGFAFALPPVAVGVFALKDVKLGAALTLPFLDGKPTFDFNVSERQHPFLLTVSFFGGGGFFRLQLDTAGMKLIEAAFEFGAAASIDIGVASGGVQIMAGIYFKLERQEPSNELAPTLSGYLRLGGYLSVLGLIKISVEFNLSFTYDGAKDKAYGRATLTVKVEIVFFSTSVELTVERAFGGQSGDPTFGELYTTADNWSEYALAFA